MSPYPAQYSVLVLDNVSIHKSQYLRDLCEEKGIRLEYLPPYSPDFNLVRIIHFIICTYKYAETCGTNPCIAIFF